MNNKYKKEQQQEIFKELFDNYYNENICYIEGDIIYSNFKIPLNYIKYIKYFQLDYDIQLLFYNEILPNEFNTTNNYIPANNSQNSSQNNSQNYSHNSYHNSHHNSNKENQKNNNSLKYLPNLYIIKTKGDSDCLLHAISINLWGYDDNKRYLRGLLSLAFSSESLLNKFFSYYCEEELYRDEVIGFPKARDVNSLRSDLNIAAGMAHEVGRLVLK